MAGVVSLIMVCMRRAAFLVLAALGLPACHGRDNEIFIANGGAGTAIVEIFEDCDCGDHDVGIVELAPGGSIKIDFHSATEVTVIIRRQSDGTLLFLDDFDEDDFDDEHGKIEIYVVP